MEGIGSFTGVYPVSKTLRFELRPIGRTLEYIEKEGIIGTDIHRAESYKTVKKIIDNYHKAYMEDVLSNLRLEDLDKYYNLYQKSGKSDSENKEFEDVQTSLRKQISSELKSDRRYKNIFKKELIQNDIFNMIDDEEDKKLVEEFRSFTTYFTGFHKNRENIYSDEAKSTSIAFRLIHQNLPKYLDNIKIYKLVSDSPIKESLKGLEDEIKTKYQIDSIEDYFKLEGFNKVLTQHGIDIYNTILGAFSEEKKKIQGINELINLYNQKQKDRNAKLPQMKPLFKQILSDRNSVSFIVDSLESDCDVLSVIDGFSEMLFQDIINSESKSVLSLLKSIKDYNLEKIYIKNDTSISFLSEKLFNDWSFVGECIGKEYDRNHNYSETEKYHEKKKAELKKIGFYSIAYLDMLTGGKIEDYFTDEIESVIDSIQEKYKEYLDIHDSIEDSEDKKSLLKRDAVVSVIKAYLDSIKDLQALLKLLLTNEKIADKDERFYSELDIIWNKLDAITNIYNQVRNYVTKKPYSVEKVKLNFNKSTLLDGWDKNKEKDNLGIILIKDGKYYLGIMNTKANKSFTDVPQATSGDVYKKMVYKLLPDPSKMLPKVFFSKKGKEEFNPDEVLLSKYYAGTHKKNNQNFSLEDCHNLIDFFKDAISKHDDWSKFGFVFSETSTYSDMSMFYREISEQAYKLTLQDIDAEYIDTLVENGDLYLFQIYNKDFSEYSKGKPNLHTMYWKALFSKENLDDIVYKLNGQAEVFYRKKSIPYTVTHKANVPIKNKYPNSVKSESIFEYDLIKNKRFTMDKFMFHVPITMNYKASGENKFNLKVRKYIHDVDEINIIGIDRGERNLLYICVVNQNGEILEQKSLNEILTTRLDGECHAVDYHLLLDNRENDNKLTRKSWTTVNTIKELKEGYLSQVIHVVAQMMIKYNAIVVLEDLNFGFMRGRQKFEKQVYQKFEKMLIDKLNYLVMKDYDEQQPGGLMKAFQFTDRFESFQKLGKQSGFLFYIPAWMTSKIDPTTGFVPLFNAKYESVEKARLFIKKFKGIKYNNVEGCFEFKIDYSDFTYKSEGTKLDWTICSYGTRIRHFRNKDMNNSWDTEEIDLSKEFMKLFNDYGVCISGDNIIDSITEIKSADFYKNLFSLINLMMQMRNSDEKSGIDRIVSPVRNHKGDFFNTSVHTDSDVVYPKDADANGAYNIARKGSMIIDIIKNTEPEKLEKIKLAISNKEWLRYAQENTI